MRPGALGCHSRMEKIPYLGRTLLRWRVGSSVFLALPELGARLMNWNITLGDGSVRDVLYWPEVAALDGFEKVRGGNPVLFPFAGRSFDRGDINFWRDAAGVRRPMPMHGLARQGNFEIDQTDDHGFIARFVPGAEARACYPFEYGFTVAYRFEPLGLACEFTLENLGSEPLPWCAGHHFYFTVPWSEGSRREDYVIRIPAGRRLRWDAAGKLVPGPVLQEEESLGQPGLIDTFHTALRSNQIVFGEKGRHGDVVVRLGTADVPPPGATVVTWTAADDSPFFCVEPWMGPANSMENKLGLQLVPPGNSGKFSVSVHLR
jgi:galactose mutarotase-like enzyme